MSDPRKDPEAAYQAFMSMPQSEWIGLIGSLIRGGVLEPAEQKGFVRAMEDRKVPHDPIDYDALADDESVWDLTRAEWHV